MKRQLARISLATAVFVVLGLAGCSDRKVEDEVRSVAWYEANKDERATKLAQCMSNPDNDATPNCINASRAENNSKAATDWVGGNENVRTPASIND
ncbi:MAG: EexN family lipoprotein [Nitrosospira sp.]